MGCRAEYTPSVSRSLVGALLGSPLVEASPIRSVHPNVQWSIGNAFWRLKMLLYNLIQDTSQTPIRCKTVATLTALGPLHSDRVSRKVRRRSLRAVPTDGDGHGITA